MAQTNKHQYCSQNQKEELVRLVTENKNLLSGKLTHQFTNKDLAKKWILIASKLNAVPGGQEDWKQWRKVFEEAITPKEKKRSVASNRLLTSATATTHLANLSKERLELEKPKFESNKVKFRLQFLIKKRVQQTVELASVGNLITNIELPYTKRR
ncbi:hypothetical protein RN001_001231 [Aquatica leii]|uniref:Regulatory protein zeste n=1 Tax=Aquatica leii TaxID=1421715 RepID=A0AAN7QA84_9COLE|nr:hypothetical protein RN001_001231 [Aquatica leii]